LAQLPPLPAAADPVLARQCQLAGGDDYELVFSAAPAKRAEITELAVQLALPLWRCGRVIGAAPGQLTLFDDEGQAVPIKDKGYDHFG
jgi:thiamine-monophosphate kinase